MNGQSAHEREERWRGHPILSALLRAVIFIVPVAASVGTTRWLSHYVTPLGKAEHAVAVGLLLLVSTLVLLVADRQMRRLMPMVVLLKLSLAFPNEAPSRMRLARAAASTKDLEARVEEARKTGFRDEPARAAEHILTLVAAVESHDRATRGHSERVRVYTDMLATQMGLPLRDRDRLRWAALLHDVGKLEVPKRILTKPGKLTKTEWEAIYLHPAEGMRLTAPLREWLGEWATAIEQHHERYDGRGYPLGLQGGAISLGGRMVAVTDSYETMTATRPYRRALSAAKARAELVRCSGTDYDPAIVRSFLEISIKRLGRASGPLSWLAQTPILRGLEQAASTAGRAAAATATAGAGAAILALAPATASTTTSTPKPSPTISVRSTPATTRTVSATASPSQSPSVEPSPTTKPTGLPTTSPEPVVKRPSPSPSSTPKRILSPSPAPWTGTDTRPRHSSK